MQLVVAKAVGPAVRDLTVADMVEIESDNIMGKVQTSHLLLLRDMKMTCLQDVSIELSKCQFMEIISDVGEQVNFLSKTLYLWVEFVSGRSSCGGTDRTN